MANYFNTLNLRQQLAQLGKCRFMARDEFADGASYLQGKKVVIVGCGAQGLNQGLNMRDSGLDISYALRKEAIAEKRASWRKATENGFKVGTYEELIPQADLVVNLTPDKQHSDVVRSVQPLMKDGAALGYSHGFNIVEVGEQIRKDITVVMVAPKCRAPKCVKSTNAVSAYRRLSRYTRKTTRKAKAWRLPKHGLRRQAATARACWSLPSWRK